MYASLKKKKNCKELNKYLFQYFLNIPVDAFNHKYPNVNSLHLRKIFRMKL